MTNTETTSPAKFIVGNTYSTGEGRDYTWRFRVVSRTAKFITVVAANRDGSLAHSGVEGKRVGVFTGWQGGEAALPLGRYSMAPTISADSVLVEAGR